MVTEAFFEGICCHADVVFRVSVVGRSRHFPSSTCVLVFLSAITWPGYRRGGFAGFEVWFRDGAVLMLSMQLLLILIV